MHDHLHDKPKPQLLQIAPLPPQKPHDHHTEFMVGLDVGSTTVKATVVDAATDKVLWQDYQRHETKQPEKSLEFLRRMEKEVGINPHNTRMFMTGSGAAGLPIRLARSSCRKLRRFRSLWRRCIPKCIR